MATTLTSPKKHNPHHQSSNTETETDRQKRKNTFQRKQRNYQPFQNVCTIKVDNALNLKLERRKKRSRKKKIKEEEEKKRKEKKEN